MTSKKRIGFLSYWGFARGLSYLTLTYIKMIHDEYDCFVFKQGTNPILPEFQNVKVDVFEYPKYIVDREVFKKWLIENKIDVCVFNEYKQWNDDPNELIQLCKELKIKTYGILVLEKFKPEQANEYDRILASSKSFEKVMRQNKIRHFTYVPMSLDMNEFPDTQTPQNEKFTFFHPGGWGGVHDRKNTWAVIEAFENLPNVEDCKLIITSQKEFHSPVELHPNIVIIDKELKRPELIDLYYRVNCTVLPSKWETIGIPILESLAAGTPIITTDVSPMNEFVNNCKNGYVCSGKMSHYPGIEVLAIDVDIKDLTQKMDMCASNDLLYKILRKNALSDAIEKFDLEKNKKYFLDLLKKDLGDK